VRWSDGHENLLFPGPGSVLRVDHRADDASAPTATSSVPADARVHEWQVRISIVESDDDTAARVVLVADTPDHLTAQGHSHRSAQDKGVPEIGDEVAVARALRVLADQLLDSAAGDIEKVTGEHDVTLRAR
jgi:hypothetical protein